MNDFFCDIVESLSDRYLEVIPKAYLLIEDKLEISPENLQFKIQALNVPQIKGFLVSSKRSGVSVLVTLLITS